MQRILQRFRAKPAAVPVPGEKSQVNTTREHERIAAALERRQRLFRVFWARLPQIRLALGLVGALWILALPYEGLWKGTYIDEHAIQPAQVNMAYEWEDVHRADGYLEELERVVHASFEVRAAYVQSAFSRAGVTSGSTDTATWAHVTPPRAAGTESILVSANWVSRDGGPNLRGIATLLSLGRFLRGQKHWAFDIILVVGDGYLTGLDTFMMHHYHALFPSAIWTALNVDYPGHSFSHIGVFYEGVNGRLPNQDVPNTIAHVGRWAGGAEMRLHDVENTEPRWLDVLDLSGWGGGEVVLPRWMGRYVLGARHLWEHARYMALGRASGAHGVLARHRIDSSTLYCSPSTGPHGFHTLGRTLESTLRSLNNLLERLHASYFFYLLPRPGKFIPVGHYLPSAILLGASLTLGGFDCPAPLEGALHLLPAVLVSIVAWRAQSTLVAPLVLLWRGRALLGWTSWSDPSLQDARHARSSAKALLHLLYGALVPTLAMVNYPQALLLAALALLYLAPLPMSEKSPAWTAVRVVGLVLVQPAWLHWVWPGMEAEWALGNVAWPAVFGVWMPLWCAVCIL